MLLGRCVLLSTLSDPADFDSEIWLKLDDGETDKICNLREATSEQGLDQLCPAEYTCLER